MARTEIVMLGGHAYARFGPVSINVSAANPLTDAMITEYIEGTIAIGRGSPTALSLSHYAHAVPNAKQRQLMYDTMQRHGLPRPDRQALLTDSAMMRGAMVAFAWLTGTDSASYAISDREKAIAWLAEKHPFDVAEAKRVLERCFDAVGLRI